MSNQVSNNDNDSKKIFTVLIMVFTLMVCTTGATYAYFAISASNTAATGTAAKASLELTVIQEPLKTTSNSGVMVPQLESALASAMNETNKCVDGNNNIICKVYEVKVTNKSTTTVKLNSTIQFLVPVSSNGGDNTFTNLYWRKTATETTLGDNSSIQVTNSNGGAIVSGGEDDDEKAVDCSVSGNHCSKIYDISAGTVCNTSSGEGCSVTQLPVGGSATFHVVIWINETNLKQNNTDKGTWEAIINFEAENGKGITSTIVS